MSASVLKLIALIAMIIDHIGELLQRLSRMEGFAAGYGSVFTAMRVVGRIAFVIYAFFVAEGCRKTKDMRKYLLRLALFALISEIPFDMCFSHYEIVPSLTRLIMPETGSQNVFFTLFLGAFAIYLWESVPKGPLKPICAVVPLLLAELLRTDYGMYGVAVILAFYVLPEKWTKVAAACVFSLLLYFEGADPPLYALPYVIGGWAGAALTGFYNGKRGFNAKWVFYAAYPAHLAVLALAFQAALRVFEGG